MEPCLVFPIHEASEAGAARRAMAKWTAQQGWSEESAGRVALVVTELGRNLALHTRSGGKLILRGLTNGKLRGVEILSLDDGPGMENISECLRDGFSSIGTAGIGLGAVQRASHAFAAHSQTGIGTALLSEIWNHPPEPGAIRWRSGGLNVCAPNEIVCGDQWEEFRLRADLVRVIVADGLGHGEFAAQASRLAVELFAKHHDQNLATSLEMMNVALRSTRGAAVALAEIDLSARQLHFAGVGNIAGVIVGQGSTINLVSMNGTVGGQCRGIRLFSHPFPQRAALIMASDGLKTQWDIQRYAGLSDRPPGLIAGVLYRDYLRGRDDATVVVLKDAA